MGTPEAAVGLGFLTVLESVADAVPAIDNLLDTVMTAVRPVAGFVIATAPDNGNLEIPLAVTGGVIALGLHFVKAATRAVSTLTTAGTCNCCISICETIATVIVILLVVSISVLALACAVAAIVGAIRGMRRAC